MPQSLAGYKIDGCNHGSTRASCYYCTNGIRYELYARDCAQMAVNLARLANRERRPGFRAEVIAQIATSQRFRLIAMLLTPPRRLRVAA